ncbi:MAG: hypothetical protein HW377_1288 [Actinobacteria bacterium]|nr:hypothetical protein [Actinomycetota bacterium]
MRLPSGRLATVGQIKLVQPLIEKKIGRSLSSIPKRASLSGPAVKVTAKSDWKEIIARPDGTVLESPDGTRITVGELKQAFGPGGKAPPGATRKGAAPAAAPR